MVFLSSGPQGNGRGRKPSSVVGRSSIYSPRRREALAISLEARRAAVSLLIGSCIGWGLQRNRVATARVSSYLAFPALPGQKPGRYISVALSLESPPPAVSRHPALRSPDFPHSYERDCPTYSHNPNHYKTTSPSCQTLKQLPPTNSLISELFGISSPGAARK